MKPLTFIPIDNKNSEEYRSNILLLIQKYEFEEIKNRKDLDKINKYVSGYFIFFGSMFSLSYVVAVFYNDYSNGTNLLVFILGIISIIVGVILNKNNNQKESYINLRLDLLSIEIKECRNAYNYAVKHKNKDGLVIYENNSTRLF